MKFPSVNTLLILTTLVAQAWALLLALINKRAAKTLKTAALLQFRSALIDSQDPRYRFDGASARMVRQDEWGPIQGILDKKPNYTLTIYARNEAGEYFVFRSAEHGQGSVKHLEPKIARVVLKERYTAPESIPKP